MYFMGRKTPERRLSIDFFVLSCYTKKKNAKVWTLLFRCPKGNPDMLKSFKSTILLFLKILVFGVNAAVFFLLFSIENPFLLHFSRTSGITVISFTLVYCLLNRVYGGYDIGKQKSKPIIYALSISVMGADLVAHLFLSIMNVTVVHGGHFVYEQPLLLLMVYVIQVLWIVLMTTIGNDLYFRLNVPQKCLVITSLNEDAIPLLQKLARFKKQYKIVAVVSANQSDLLEQIDACDAVFIYELAVPDRAFIIEYCYQVKKDIYYSIEMADIVALGGERVLFDDKSMICSSVKELTMEQRIIKRTMDLLVSGIGTIVALPIMLVVALAIKLEDHGHVFYKQKRATYGGRVFEVYKFRSMREEGSVNRSVTKDDDRITKVGRVIRKFRLDELPQLLNILKGDMSLVGPRPEMIENVEKYTGDLPEFVYRLRVKAGLTGMAQIYGKYNTSPKDKLIMDLTYIERYSFWMDIKILLRTVLVLLKPDESTEAFEVKPEKKEPAEKAGKEK